MRPTHCACGGALIYAGVGVYPSRCPDCARRRRNERNAGYRAQTPIERRRLWWRNSWRRKAARMAATRRTGQATCPHRIGPHYVCGGKLEVRVLPGGRTVTICPRCELRNAGRCVDCGRRRECQHRHQLRCNHCRHAAVLATRRRYYDTHVSTKRRVWAARMRDYRATHPELRESARRYAQRHRIERKRQILRGARSVA